MPRKHAAVLSLLMGVAAVAGALAATRAVAVGASTKPKPVPDALVAKRDQALDRFEASLRRALAKKPPKLPPVPAYPRVQVPALATAQPTAAPQPASTSQPAAAPQKVVYKRPAPVVQYVQPQSQPAAASHGEDDEAGDD